MSIDVSLPVELNRSRANFTISNPRVVGDHIVVDNQHGTEVSFHVSTGIMVGEESADNPTRIRNKSDEVAVKYYRIWFGHKDWPKADWRYLQDDSQYQFDDGKTANEKAKALNKESADAEAPWKFMVKSHTVMSPNHKWREWMEARFESGEYAALPWANEDWYIKDHFAHPASSDPFKVAFVESVVNGAEDKMTVLNPGRYLERFYSNHLNAQQIAAWAAKADNEAELLFAVTPDEIEDVYVNGGIDSCMRYPADDSHFPLGIQPTRIYGAGDLQLAYLKRRGKIVGRALVWPEKKKIGRIYGDVERLKNRLLAEGFEYNEGDNMAFDGAKLLRIEVSGEIVLPYLDWSMGAEDMGDHLVIRRNGDRRTTFKGQTQNGTASGRSIHLCGHQGCRTVVSEDGGNSLYNSQTGRQMCLSCADQHLRRDVLSGSFYPELDRSGNVAMVQIMSRDGVTPFPGPRGGWAHVGLVNDYCRGQYRLINGVIYPSSETEVVPGRSRVFRPIPVDA